MCGSCGATGPMVSYEVGDYVSFTYPQKGISESAHGEIISLNDQWGIELKILSEIAEKNSSIGDILWIDWPPFSCIIEYPGFKIVRVDYSAIPAKIIDNIETKINRNKSITIGHGWLQKPFILKQQNEKEG